MSVISGPLSLRRFIVLGPVPSEAFLCQALEMNQFRPFQDGSEEERVGWCDWRNPLIVPPDVNWVGQDRFTVLGLRIDSRKVPAGTLKATVDLRIQALLAEKEVAFVGKDAKLALQDEVRAELLRKVMPSMKLHQVLWDAKGGVLLTDANSSRAQALLTIMFMKSFNCELQPLTPLFLAGRICPEIPVEDLLAMEPLDLQLEATHG